MKIHPVGVELFHVDGHTENPDEANSRFSRLKKRRISSQFGEGKKQVNSEISGGNIYDRELLNIERWILDFASDVFFRSQSRLWPKVWAQNVTYEMLDPHVALPRIRGSLGSVLVVKSGNLEWTLSWIFIVHVENAVTVS